MNRVRRTLIASTLSLLALSHAATAQTSSAESSYQPEPGQPGKDVIWLPTDDSLVVYMLTLAEVTARDYVIDLGSGDGRLVIEAARRGARAHGIEYNPDLVELSKRHAAAAGVSGRATFEKADIFASDFSRATVITMFLLPELNMRLRPILLDMKPGTRIVSNSFDMGDWMSDDKVQVKESCQTYCHALKWIVPAKVAGRWRLGDGELVLEQTYQMIKGTLRQGGNELPLSDAKMTGAQISFVADGQSYTAQVVGNRMSGRVGGSAWSATRR